MKKIFFCVLPVLMFLTCTRELSEPKVFSLAGTASLSGQSDYSGITVELYTVAPLDTAIANRLTRFPSVGVDLKQDPLFDHRLAEPVYATETDAEGKFAFNDIPDDRYHLVAEKPGYGWRYHLNISNATAAQPIESKLFLEMTSPGAIETYTVWPANHHIILNNNLVIREGGTVLIDKGCVVRLGGDYEIRGDGAIQVNGTVDDMVWFTANTPSKDTGYIAWRGIVANGSADLNFARIDFAETGIRISSSEYIIRNSLVSKIGSNGILIARESNGTLEDNALVDCSTGLRVEGNSFATIQYNLFLQMENRLFGTGVAINDSRAIVENNIFRGFSLGFTFEFSSYGDFTHNLVEACESGIYINKASTDKEKPVVIKSNILQNCSEAIIQIFNCNSPVVESNNFSAYDSYLISGYAVHWQNEKAVYFPNNFWGMTIESDILAQIYMADNEVNSPPYIVHVNPIATQPFGDAGPR
ncbi:hypothetical protein EH223_03870 [candidate division KSB1 bacterium]|nr:right-handed parallel beta-helix repeat-containing protein [candidate division KSB1 bacterium]RQW05735.1 MAG: hypothetical protein EH223_03870 [candidate division KSB1 bacterium]